MAIEHRILTKVGVWYERLTNSEERKEKVSWIGAVTLWEIIRGSNKNPVCKEDG